MLLFLLRFCLFPLCSPDETPDETGGPLGNTVNSSKKYQQKIQCWAELRCAAHRTVYLS